MKILLLALLLTGCASIGNTVECVQPQTEYSFMYDDFFDYSVQGNILILTDKESNKVMYAIPEGTACKITPTENSNNYEREEHEVYSNIDPNPRRP